MISDRTLRVLEFTRIREILAEEALTESGALLCRELVPFDELENVKANRIDTHPEIGLIEPVLHFIDHPGIPPTGKIGLHVINGGFQAVLGNLIHQMANPCIFLLNHRIVVFKQVLRPPCQKQHHQQKQQSNHTDGSPADKV